MVTSVDDLGQGAPDGAPGGDGGTAPGPALLRQIPRTDQLLADPRMRAAGSQRDGQGRPGLG